jgi:hypothetical protein
MDGPNYTPFNLGFRHHAFGPYAPHLQAAKYTCKYQNILLFLGSLVTNNKNNFVRDVFFGGRGLCFYNSRCFVILKLRNQYIKLSRISLLNSGGSVLVGGCVVNFDNI